MTKFNPDTCTKIITALEHGNYRKTAAALAGVTEETLCNWIRKGRESKTKKGKYFQFFQSVKRAEEKATAWHLQQIQKASEDGTWQASAWYLERKKPDEWGRRQRVEMEHSGHVKQEVDATVKINVHDRIREYERQLQRESTTPDGDDTG